MLQTIGGIVCMVKAFQRAKEEERRLILLRQINMQHKYRGLDSGVPCIGWAVQEPWQDVHY